MGRNRIKINPECGKRVKRAKKAYGLTYDDLAGKLCCDRNHISNIVQGKRNLTPDMARRMVETAFPDVRYEWLLCWDDFRTEADKEKYKQSIWEESAKAAADYEDKIRAVIGELLYQSTGLEIVRKEEDLLLGACVRAFDGKKNLTGLICEDALLSVKKQAENYISYLLRTLVEKEVSLIPISSKEAAKNG